MTPSTDSVTQDIVLIFDTENLIAQNNTATITATFDGETNQLIVNADVSPLNIFKLEDDPLRSRTYGIQQNGVELGSIVILEPISGNHIGNVTVGKRPCDLVESDDGLELLVINSVDETISVIDLTTLSIKETINLPVFDNWDQSVTTANIDMGPGDIIYYTDGGLAPALWVLDRGTLQVLQKRYSSPNTTGGFGDFAITSDHSLVFGWRQNEGNEEWSKKSYMSKFTVNASGLLTFVEKSDYYSTEAFSRDPRETPVLISADDQTVFIKGLVVESSSVNTITRSFPTPIYSITPLGEVAVTDTAIYETATGIKLVDLPVSTPVKTITTDYARLVYFDPVVREIKTDNLLELVDPEILYPGLVPADHSSTLSPRWLRWSPLTGVDRYRVYLGLSEAEVAGAGTDSSVYLGEVNTICYELSESLDPGITYYWRVDAVTESDTIVGEVFDFAVSTISCSIYEIEAFTVQGNSNNRAVFEITTDFAIDTWQARSNEPWVTFIEDNGTMPATIEVRLDASQLAVGLNRADITISDGVIDQFTIPVRFEVDVMNVTIMKSDPDSPLVYAISEDTSSYAPRAYLLEINTISEEIERVAAVGASVTDLAVHHGDNRVYVPNWEPGYLRAIDLDTLEEVRVYEFAPFVGIGSTGDVYRVSAGGPGRLVIEEGDQEVDFTIFDTVSGTVIANTCGRAGGGGFDPTGRYYYHGNYDSFSYIYKFDVTGDQFLETAQEDLLKDSDKGSPTVVISEDGGRVFWNGGVFDKDLNVEWLLGEEIYAASADGRYAIGESTVIDVVRRSVRATLGTSTDVKAYNSNTDTLVFREEGSIGFQRLYLFPDVLLPDGAVVYPPESLGWEGLSLAEAYQVYLGQSEEEVAAADMTSPLFLGETSSPEFTLSMTLSSGTYYWRVDVVTPYGTIIGRVNSFVVSPIIPDTGEINLTTIQGVSVTRMINLSSQLPGKSWTATADAGWISIEEGAGTTPAAIRVTLDPGITAPAVRTGLVTVSGSGGELFTIPVRLEVDAMNVTIMKSDPGSPLVYAISEDTSSVPSRAHLLEINTISEEIERVVEVGTSVTDLAVHHGDNRVYVPNWEPGYLRAIDLDTFEEVRVYEFIPVGVYIYGRDVFRVSAGGPGRLVIEERYGSVDVSIFDTVSGTILANTIELSGGGGFDSTGRYYYHGENRISYSKIYKFDVTGDQFLETAQVLVSNDQYNDSSVVVVSEDGGRVFWNGGVFDKDLKVEWLLGEEIYAASADGRYAIGESAVFDVVRRSVRATLGTSTDVKAYNSSTDTLVFREGGSIGFQRLYLPQDVVPSYGATVYPPESLGWEGLSLAEAYQVYLGQSEEEVAAADMTSPLFLGETSSPEFTLSMTLSSGTYYWRVDVVTPYGTIIGRVNSFVVSPIIPDRGEINLTTIQGVSVTRMINLSSQLPGESWTATADAGWISIEEGAGTTPAAIRVTLDPGITAPAVRTGLVTVSGSGGELFTIPVRLEVDVMNVNIMKSDPGSPLVYAISEDTSSIASRAYLLEINTISEEIERVVEVGTSATDLAVHHGDNRVYVPNWEPGYLRAIDLDTFEEVCVYEFAPFGGAYNDDVYRVSAGTPGRLVIEEEYGPLDVSIFDTVSDTILASTRESRGRGGFDPTGRYYYHGEYGSFSEIHKFDVTGDQFLETAQVRVANDPYNDSSVVVVSEDGGRVFWNGGVFDKDLKVEWLLGEEIYAASADGRYAIGESAVFDVVRRSVRATLGTSTDVKAYNSITDTLVFREGGSIGFQRLYLPQDVVPSYGAAVYPPESLGWEGLSLAEAYQVYLGQSEEEVAAADMTSPLFLGETSSPEFTLSMTLSSGTYYWRVDVVTPYGTIIGRVNSFVVSPIIPDRGEINLTTIQGVSVTRVINLSSQLPGESWTATADAGWISIEEGAGTTPAAIRVTLDPGITAPAVRTGLVTVSGSGGELFAIPVRLEVDVMNVTIMKSDPGSPLVYAISEDTSSIASRAYLLEINTISEEIERVVEVGTSATDLAVHHGDNRVYVPNWEPGYLRAIDLDTFEEVRVYEFAPFGGAYSDDVYRVSAGAPGRLVIEEEDVPLDVSIFDTVSGTILASTREREGGGGFDPTGRYYYHGEYDSFSYIYKFDVTGDQFLKTAQEDLWKASENGSPTVVVSEDGGRVFWNGGVFDKDLKVEWLLGEEIYAASADGRYAIGESAVFDVVRRSVRATLGTSTDVKAYNSITDTLVFREGGSIGFQRLYLPQDVVPSYGATVYPPESLGWEGLSLAEAYQVYLGQSEEEVAAADMTSPLFLGETSSPEFTLSMTLSSGTYYWRVDVVTPYGTIIGCVNSFVVSPIIPDTGEINLTTIQGVSVTRMINLSSQLPGESWTATADAGWISIEEGAGTTPAAIRVTLDPGITAPAVRTGLVTVSGSGGELFAIPVRLEVDVMNVNIMKSDPGSPLVYAISEDTSSVPSRAHLLEINTISEEIERVVEVGTSVTDLAVHHGDNRVYVPNWEPGDLRAIDLDTFEEVRVYEFAPFGGLYYEGDVYRVSAGGPGRLVIEEEDQVVEVSIFDTVSGTILASTREREGGGGFDPTGRYYYHGEYYNNEIHKFDVTGDQFLETAQVPVSNFSYVRTVVVSEDGGRVFWNGRVFDKDLNVEWLLGEEIYAASADGRYAIGESAVFDVVRRSVRATLGTSTDVKAYNSITETLVFREGGSIGFQRLYLPQDVVPSYGAAVYPPESLGWEGLSLAEAYQVYLGQSEEEVAAADMTSPLFLGETSSPEFTLSMTLSSGTYYWRVDVVTPYGTIIGRVNSFVVSPIIPDRGEINLTTIQGVSVSRMINLSSQLPGESWTATADAGWISIEEGAGTTPAAIRVTLDPGITAPAVRTGLVTLSGSGGELFTIPVRLEVDVMNVTIMKSDPGSPLVYAISEDTSSVPSRAHLLEINTISEEIERVVEVGTSVTDLAVHHGDNRVYVPNWEPGDLRAIDLDTFEEVRVYKFAPSDEVYSDGDVYRVSAGGPGRLVIEERYGPVDVSIFDTVSGTILANTIELSGRGGFDPTGRYYYRDEYYYSKISKFDVTGDQFLETAQVLVENDSYDGSRTVVVSEDGGRVFWNDVFDKDLNVEWLLGETIYTASADGRYAFSYDKIYDIEKRTEALDMPVITEVSAFNTNTKKLTAQQSGELVFFKIISTVTIDPSGSVAKGQTVSFTTNEGSIDCLWDGTTIYGNFVSDVLNTTMVILEANLPPYTVIESWGADCDSTTATTCTINNLTEDISISPVTLAVPSVLSASDGIYEDRVEITWNDVNGEDGYRVFRSETSGEGFVEIGTTGPDVTTYIDGQSCGVTFYYRVASFNAVGESPLSAEDPGFSTFINAAPVADPGGPYIADVGNGLTLNGSGSSDPDEGCGDSIESYSWDLNDDGTYDDALGRSPYLTWGDVETAVCGGAGRCVAGLSYPVALKVTDTYGESRSASSTLILYINQPLAAFSADPNPALCRQKIIFDASFSYSNPESSKVSFEWDFDYAGTFTADAIGVKTTHAYDLIGSHTVALRVTDGNDLPKTDIATAEITITIENMPPVADAGGPYLTVINHDLVLDAYGSSDPNESCGDYIVAYQWDLTNNGFFDDASGASVIMPWEDVEMLICDGTCDVGTEYPIALKVTDSLGLENIFTTTFSITYQLFSDDFSHGTRAGDPEWLEASGNWKVGRYRRSKQFYSLLRRNNRALVQNIPDLDSISSGCFETKIELTDQFRKAANGALIFCYEDNFNYRYVRLVKNPGRKGRVIIGQVGNPSGTIEPEGVKKKRRLGSRRLNINKKSQLRVDVYPDGLVNVFVDNMTVPVLSYAFIDVCGGKVGCQATRAKTYFDNFRAWDKMVLQK